MPKFPCSVCHNEFDVPETTLLKYPGWVPRFCMQHRGNKGQIQQKPPRDPNVPVEIRRIPAAHAAGSKTWRGGSVGGDAADLTPEQVLQMYHAGPQTGIFTDGGSRPNPGVGGWGFVHVQDGVIIAEGRGGEKMTTNNRMEMTAIIRALQTLAVDQAAIVFSDSDLCVKTLTVWAKGWKSRGWKKKDGEIKNLDLVQEAYALFTERTKVKLQWIKAHDGSRWNEYVDALATLGLKGQ